MLHWLRATLLQQLNLDLPIDGTTKRDILLKGLERDNKPAFLIEQLKELEPLSLEPLGDYAEYALVILGCFNDLSSARGQGMSTMLPITYYEIESYSSLMNIEFTPWEVTTIKYLDRVYTTTVNKHMREQEEKAKQGT